MANILDELYGGIVITETDPVSTPCTACSGAGSEIIGTPGTGFYQPPDMWHVLIIILLVILIIEEL